MSYNIQDYARLGLLHKLLQVEEPDHPSSRTIAQVQKELIDAVADVRAGTRDLSSRRSSEDARETRRAGLLARARMEREWGTL